MKKISTFTWLGAACTVAPLIVAAAIGLAADDKKPADASAPAPVQVAPAEPFDEHILTLAEIRARPMKPLLASPSEPAVARLVSRILEQSHYSGSEQPLNDEMSAALLKSFIEELDNTHMHFLQGDIDEFNELYKNRLDDLLYRGDTSPAREIFKRFLERLDQRVGYVDSLLDSADFDFTTDEVYKLDRSKAPRPKDLEAAQQTWRQHLKHEFLQEKLNNEEPEEIKKIIRRRYARLLRTLKDYEGSDVFELYLSTLARAYDPHSDYMGKDQLENFAISMKLSLFGIGALLGSEDGYCKIISLIPGGPAEQSKKLKANDRVIAVAQGDGDPVDVIDMKLNKIVDMIRGAKGTEVRLTVIPADAADPSDRKVVRLIRDEIKLEEQEAKAKIFELPGQDGKAMRLGFIDLPSFYADFDLSGEGTSAEPKSTTRDVKRLLEKLKSEKVDGVILDLRRNGGGSLEEAINLTGLFIKKGPVVQVKGPTGRPIVESDTDPAIVYDGPLIVLTSRFSASASEILAGALQDYGRALIVGDSATHGKGTVQSLIQLEPHLRQFMRSPENPGALKITIRKFYRPSGSSTQLKGIIPDIVLPSVNNHAEVGEASLENPLAWDSIPPANFAKRGDVQPYLDELRSRSEKRVEVDSDFAYVKQDIEQLKKALLEKSVSLSESVRLQEKREAEERKEKREAELKARPESPEKVYEITLKNLDNPGLPPAMTAAEARQPKPASGSEHPAETEDGEGEEEEDSLPPIDVSLEEAKRILVDYITLLDKDKALAKTGL